MSTYLAIMGFALNFLNSTLVWRLVSPAPLVCWPTDPFSCSVGQWGPLILGPLASLALSDRNL